MCNSQLIIFVRKVERPAYWQCRIIKILHTGNTRPSRMCVVKEYRYYTISLSKYYGCCQYHKSSSIWSKNSPNRSTKRSRTVKNGPYGQKQLIWSNRRRRRRMGKTTVKRGPTSSLTAKNSLETVSYCLFFLIKKKTAKMVQNSGGKRHKRSVRSKTVKSGQQRSK